MKKLALLAALITATTGATALQASNYGMISQETRAQITEKLTAQGYDVRKIDAEDGMIEVYALKDGQRLELYLDKDLNIARSKTDD
ncbi:PepSY domain-containing protein [Pseudooceanicola sp. MF1-13]|uniref:PepSY domain-containing protein n=1 Tax=Pseudooceanicola sp. MF1-13 TaxID=3379095 RepID=UPI003892A2D9